jgi:nucleoside-triphosphatase THEP1
MPAEHLVASEAVCWQCRSEAFGQALRADMVQIIDETLGLGETDRRAIRSFIETIFTDPKKILQVRDLDNRVRYLEKQNNIMWTVIGGVIIAPAAMNPR